MKQQGKQVSSLTFWVSSISVKRYLSLTSSQLTSCEKSQPTYTTMQYLTCQLEAVSQSLNELGSSSPEFSASLAPLQASCSLQPAYNHQLLKFGTLQATVYTV